MKGIIQNDKAVGIEDLRQINTSRLSFRIEYLNNVPMAKVKNIIESNKPRKKLLIANFYYN
jgi:hypothetical protein